MTYETVFTNLRRKEAVKVYETYGLLVTLLPGQSLAVESESAATTFAKWDQVVFTDDQDSPVKLHTRPGWKEPEIGRWTISLLNEQGRDVEPLEAGGRTIYCTRGIPIILAVAPEDPLARFSRLVCHQVVRRTKPRDWWGIYLNEQVLAWEAFSRPQSELDELVRERDERLKAVEAQA